MVGVHFSWDPAKAESNVRKHGVSFEEASELFTSGVDYLEIFDDAHSESEERFIAIGPTDGAWFSLFGRSATMRPSASSARVGRCHESENCS